MNLRKRIGNNDRNARGFGKPDAELDKNVDPASTMQVVTALIKANKDFEMLIVPGAGHGILGSAYRQRRLVDFFARAFFEEKEGR